MLFLLLFSFLLLVLCFSVSIVHSTLVSCFLILYLVPHCVWSAKRQYFGFSAQNIVYPHSWCSLMHEFIWVFRLMVYLSKVEFSLYTYIYTICIIQNHILYSIDYYKITQCTGASMYCTYMYFKRICRMKHEKSIILKWCCSLFEVEVWKSSMFMVWLWWWWNQINIVKFYLNHYWFKCAYLR